MRKQREAPPGATLEALREAAPGDKGEQMGTTGRRSKSNGAPHRSRLRGEMRRFIGEHPNGWGHQDWLQLLDRLRAGGHEIHDADAIGAMLEQERLSVALQDVKGVGPRRIRALADEYGSVWNLSRADVGEVADSARIPRVMAEQIRARLQQSV